MGNAFGCDPTFNLQVRCLLIRSQIGANGKQLVLDKGQERLIGLIVNRGDQQANKGVQLVDRSVGLDPLMGFRHALPPYQ